MNEIAMNSVPKDENLLQDSHILDNTANHLGDQTKCEALSTTSVSTTVDAIVHNRRICLVGSVIEDEATILAAQQLNLPIVTSVTGNEYIADETWTTYFILKEFEGPIYDAIYKSKHKIMGPPALQQAVSYKEAFNLTRPVYNFCMKGIVTCFTGVRKKDELIRLVNLIHSMGGSIRKDMGAKVTHLICSTSDGEKYKYALTFRLSIVRPSWVLDAWERRHETNFKADIDEFSKIHRVKAFEGKRICFFGFPPDEHSHMVDVLRLNGGIPTEIDDPECTHVIMAQSGEHFQLNCPSSPKSDTSSSNDSPDDEIEPGKENNFLQKLENLEAQNEELPIVQEENMTEMNDSSIKFIDDGKIEGITPIKDVEAKNDGIVLTLNEDNEFLNPNNISPILKLKSVDESLQKIDEDDEEFDPSSHFGQNKQKRRRHEDSFDNISIISTDSLASVSNYQGSAKKPKLIRTGSITRGLRRSMSFAAIKTPIANMTNMIRSRRNSVDPNASITSITSIDTTFNESIKKPVKEKLRSIRDKITKSNKKESTITPKSIKNKGLITSSNLDSLKKVCKFKSIQKELKTPDATLKPEVEFKTPIAPVPFPSFLSNAAQTTGNIDVVDKDYSLCTDVTDNDIVLPVYSKKIFLS